MLKAFINHEIGRFAVCTGAGILYGFKHLPGPRNWALWIILLPQLLVALPASLEPEPLRWRWRFPALCGPHAPT
jgi:hypothetical protein